MILNIGPTDIRLVRLWGARSRSVSLRVVDPLRRLSPCCGGRNSSALSAHRQGRLGSLNFENIPSASLHTARTPPSLSSGVPRIGVSARGAKCCLCRWVREFICHSGQRGARRPDYCCYKLSCRARRNDNYGPFGVAKCKCVGFPFRLQA